MKYSPFTRNDTRTNYFKSCFVEAQNGLDPYGDWTKFAVKMAQLNYLSARFSFLVDEQYYRKAYGDEAVDKRLFANLGCGKNWNHPFWTGFDGEVATDPKTGLHHVDFSTGLALEVPDNTFHLVYCSHLLEHFNAHDGKRLVREMLRILKPGGLIRVITPDIMLFLEAYQQNNTFFFDKFLSNHWPQEGEIEQQFLYHFAAPVSSIFKNSDRDPLPSTRVKEMFAQMPVEDALNKIIALCEDFSSPYNPHINWYSADKLCQMLSACGFVDPKESRYCRSDAFVLRDPLVFDTTQSDASVFVEARKPVLDDKSEQDYTTIEKPVS